MKFPSARRALPARRYLASLKLALCVVIIGLGFVVQLNVAAQNQSADSSDFFEKKVRPILAANCQSCHNQKARVAELDLTTAEGLARGAETGPVINRANLQESALLKVISYHEKLKMPPGGKLKDEEITTLTEWVRMGAPWPGAGSPLAATPRKPGRELTEEEKKFWAFQPMSNPQPAGVRGVRWARTAIDQFVLSRLEEKGLSPAPPADRLTLLRRATFDLTGLPPTTSEIASFLGDRSPGAFEKVVDRLLSSPRYGEQWGRRWLDVARYADSTGNDEDHRYPNAWRYRDWVIEAFNRDLPYDQFVRDQIAGDLLAAEGTDGASGVNRRGIVATGFLALGAKALAQQDKTKMLYDVYDEQVDVTTRAFLGMTVACARCHDHKFDPILARDYYSLVSIFASTRSFKDANAFVSEPLNKPLVPKSAMDQYLAAKRAHDDRVKKNRYEIDAILDGVKQPALARANEDLGRIMTASRRVYAAGADVSVEAKKVGLEPRAFERWIDYLKPGKPREHLLAWQNAAEGELTSVALEYQSRFSKRVAEWEDKTRTWRKKYDNALASNKSPLPDKPSFEAGRDRFFAEVYFDKDGPTAVRTEDEANLPADLREQLKTLRAKRDELKKQAPEEPDMACAVEDGEVVSQKVFVRGDYHNPGEDVGKEFPRILVSRIRPEVVLKGSGRLEFAKWLTDPEHPLTARVMVNRVWGWHFGEGLVRTPDNFGKMGERPSHPELLDYLARQFVRSGWSMKALNRTIMLSNSYQMASQPSEAAMAKDPENRLLSRFNRRRLSVEEMRDSLLALDGSLDLKMGGTLQSGTGTDGENDNKRLSLNPEKLNRRTVYLPLRRANLPALLNLFDFGDATTVNGRRQLTNVPTQALFWLNSDFLAERSTNLAKSFLSNGEESESQRIRRAFTLIFGRRPTIEESASAAKYLAGYRTQFAKRTNQEAWASLSRVMLAANDFNYVD
ncbi:MAG: PSD1 and planctomycete cytochrome C domain-containing protein [Acidobacteriota bacterium]